MEFEGAFFDTDKFIITSDKLGEGTFGKVYIVERKSDHKKFAAKIINPNGMLNGTDQLKFLREAEILNKLNHPSIVKFHGINFHSFKDNSKLEPTILTEYVSNGSLKNVLDREREGSVDKKWNSTKKYICIIGISNAMKYLHSKRVIHRDLKTLNVLMDEDFYPRVCDFGLSRFFSDKLASSIEEESLAKTGIVGSPLYMSPEIFDVDDDEEIIYRSSVDVYAFAIVAFEIMTGRAPFDHLKKIQSALSFMSKVKNGERPKFIEKDKEKYSEKMIDLIKKCWSENPFERPSFDEIFRLISSEVANYSKEKLDMDEINGFLSKLKESDENAKILNSNNKLSDLLFDMSTLKVGKLIGKGAVGAFYEAVLPKTEKQPETKYTLKVIDSLNEQDKQKDLLNSIEIQSSLKHQAILQFIGFSLPNKNDEKYKLITEFAPNGSLSNMIKNYKSIDDWETVKAINIFGIAAGMAFIHQHDIILADLRPLSIFLDENNYPKIGGFVNAFCFKNGEICTNESPFKGIPIYMAPELLREDHIPYSNKIDVYSYAMVLYSIFMKKNPSAGMANVTLSKIANGLRPKFNQGEIPDPFAELIQKCWSQNPDDRPSFIQMVQMFLKEKDKYFDMNVVDEEKFDKYAKIVIRGLSFW